MPRGRPTQAAGDGAATPAARGRRATTQPQVPFAHRLVLNQWLLSLFTVDTFEKLAEHLRNEALEGLDENNVHHFHHALTAQLFNLTQLPTELLLEYDQNIVKHTQRLNEARLTRGEEPVVWKYFQYLALLFTEIYLDRYFRDPKALLAAINTQLATYNEGKPEDDQGGCQGAEAGEELGQALVVIGDRPAFPVGEGGDVEHRLGDVDPDVAVHEALRSRGNRRGPTLRDAGSLPRQLFGLSAKNNGWHPS